MALVIPEGYAHVVQSISLTGDPEPMAITYGVRIDPASPPGSAGALASLLRPAFVTPFTPFFTTGFTIGPTEVKYQELAPPALPSIGVAPGATAGTGGAGTLLPQNSAFLVHKRTGDGGPRNRGRFYLPNVQESQVNNLGQLDSGTLTAIQTTLNTFLTNVNGVAGVDTMVLLHNDGGVSPLIDPTAIISLQIDPVIATQRRRLRR